MISGKLVFVARSADGRGLHTKFGFRWLKDRVSGVAVSANRGFEIAFGNAVAVRTALVVVVDPGVAGTAGFRDVGLEGRAIGIFVAEDAVRSVAALAIGRDEQAFLAECEAVNRIHVVRIDARKALLCRHGAIAMALPTGFRDIQRINGGAGICLGKNLVGVSVAACAGMFFGGGVHAGSEF